MTSTKMLLVVAFLMLSSDVVMEVSAGISSHPISCMSSITHPSPKPCDNQICRETCVKRIGYGTEGECVAKGCQCTFCTKWPPRQSTNEH
uniref:Uncharacterized protein n=1 Tax=Hordeum vulgare subsp. vulgare TaxID=112509 RepID=A0A8I6Y8C9_HORVV